jgi:HAD superfamily hydrolase (TIGR01549 family)
LLIIFDLDDTLIQTSRLITPWRFQKVLYSLCQHHNMVCDHEALSHDLAKSHQEFETSQSALAHFFHLHNVNSSFLEKATDLLNEFDESIPVEVFEGVYDMLKNLKINLKLSCVTAGKRDIQTLKIQKSKLDQSFFDSIHIVESGDKQETYEQVCSGISKEDVLVVGDRIMKDLAPAKRLGYKTVLVQQGRGQFQKINKQYVDFVIRDVTEVANLIKSIQKP